MSQDQKRICSLEEEYAFEHKARIKAEEYISELWEMHGELENEVKRLQSIINKGEHLKEKKPPLSAKFKLQKRLKEIYEAREIAIKKYEKRLK
jgi:hypothetical protein